MRIPKFLRARRACLAVQPGGRMQRRTVVITALSVTSDLAGRLRPCRAGACPAGRGAAGGDGEDRGPAAGRSDRRTIDFSRGFCRGFGCGFGCRFCCGGRAAVARIRRSLVAVITRETRLAAGIKKCRTGIWEFSGEMARANGRSGDGGADRWTRSALYCGEIVTRAGRLPPCLGRGG